MEQRQNINTKSLCYTKLCKGQSCVTPLQGSSCVQTRCVRCGTPSNNSPGLRGQVWALIRNSWMSYIQKRNKLAVFIIQKGLQQVQKASGWSLFCSALSEMFEKGGEWCSGNFAGDSVTPLTSAQWNCESPCQRVWVSYQDVAPIPHLQTLGHIWKFSPVWVPWGTLCVKEFHCVARESFEKGKNCTFITGVCLVSLSPLQQQKAIFSSQYKPILCHHLGASHGALFVLVDSLDLAKGNDCKSAVCLFFSKHLSFRSQVCKKNSHLAIFGHISACPLTSGNAASLEVAMFWWLYWCVKQSEKWKAHQHAGLKVINFMDHKE